MKISKLHIDQFRHLENLDFDFTYPKDFHIEEKRGKPLEKICFIGQSATGKTGLLELINEEVYNLHRAYKFEDLTENDFPKENNTDGFSSGTIDFLSVEINLTLKIGKAKTIPTVYYEILKKELLDNNEYLSRVITNLKKTIFYFKANLISDKNIEIFTKNPIDILEKYRDEILNPKNDFINNNFIFDDNVAPEIWLYLLNDILNYRKNFTQIMTELVHKYIKDIGKFRSEYEKWQKYNPNVLESFAHKLNPILEKLNLEVDLVNTEYCIPIKNKKRDEIIPIQETSTGTKGLLLSFLPLFKFDTKDSIILIDEPERSLYPDMQMDLMDYYQNLAPEAQFIVATHSPFIAASFEPEERFILYFDEDGKVAVRRGTSPIGDDPNDMLYNDFGINYINKFGQEKYNEYLDLKQKIHFEKDEKIKKEYAEKLEKIGDEYNF
jgi:hypothetical protein